MTPYTLPAPPLPEGAQRWALYLDVDGCLLDFADDPAAVVVTPALHRLLEALHEAQDGALALVSGRSLDDLERLFGAPPWAMAGLHGLELRDADGQRSTAAIDLADEARMRHEVFALARRLDAVQLEDKRHAVALHCRRAPSLLPVLREAARALAERLPGYALQEGDYVMEFKPAGIDKGVALAELSLMAPFAGRMPVYLGDDLTDEYAFDAANRAQGLSVRVGWREPTRARFTLPSPAAVQAWLGSVLDSLQRGATSHARSHGGLP